MIPVCFDITGLLYGRGVSRYTNNILQALSVETELDLWAWGSTGRPFAQLQALAKELPILQEQVLLDRVPVKVLPYVWQLGLLPPTRKVPKPCLLHSWDWHQPPLEKKVGLVSTIHDLAVLKFPQTAHPDVIKHHQISWEKLKQNQAQIIAVSQTTKKDVIELLGFPADRVHVVYEALPIETKATMNQLTETQYDQIKNKLKLDRPYILFVGTREPRKNLDRLIEAWRPLANDFDLIIAGAKHQQLSQPLSDLPHLRLLGRVNDQKLAVLYEEASLFAYPSLYEGFGLPILEAFSHGTPVVTSDNSGMKEVAGNAAQLVQPESVESIRQGLIKVLNENLDDQQLRLQKMIIRGQMFSWELAARQMLQIYKQAYEKII